MLRTNGHRQSVPDFGSTLTSAKALCRRDYAVLNAANSPTRFHEDPILWGSIYVDAINPSAQSVSSRLRKAILASQEDSDIGLLFILDNRFDPEKADREFPVLAQVANTVRLSEFAENYVALDRWSLLTSSSFIQISELDRDQVRLDLF
ncbi:MAG: hypothetical protein ABI389_14870 [Rhodanobacter sp.]